MVWEWNWPALWPFTRSVMWFSFDIYTEHDDDHSPGIHLCLVVANCKLLDFGYYNIYYAPDTEDYLMETK